MLRQQESFSGRRQGRGQRVPPAEIVTCGLLRDSKRHWLRVLWQRQRTRDVDSFADYIREQHPDKIPANVRNVREYMRCALRGLV